MGGRLEFLFASELLFGGARAAKVPEGDVLEESGVGNVEEVGPHRHQFGFLVAAEEDLPPRASIHELSGEDEVEDHGDEEVHVHRLEKVQQIHLWRSTEPFVDFVEALPLVAAPDAEGQEAQHHELGIHSVRERLVAVQREAGGGEMQGAASKCFPEPLILGSGP